MKPVPIPEARRLAKTTGSTRLIVIGLDDEGQFSLTTYGDTQARCRALATWAESDSAAHIAALIAAQTDGEA